MIAALAAEGIQAGIAAGAEDVPAIYILSGGSNNGSFLDEIVRNIRQQAILIASFGGHDKLDKPARATRLFNLADWDGRNRRFSEFRNLVRACLRLLGPAKSQALSLAELSVQTPGASPSRISAAGGQASHSVVASRRSF